jgi:hypothetical protein
MPARLAGRVSPSQLRRVITVLSALVIVGGAVALAVVSNLAVRRLVPLAILEEHHPVASVIVALVGGLYGILLAFVVVVVWEDFNREREGSVAEASAVADIARLAAGLAPPSAERIRRDAEAYLESAVADEWPAMEEGRPGPRLEEVSDRLWRALAEYEPADDGERNAQLVALGRMVDASDHRRRRLLASREELPGVLQFLLVAGGALLIGFSNFFGLRFRGSQLALNAGMAAMIGLVLFTVHALDHPFHGEIRVSAEEFHLALELLRAEGR